MQKIIKYILLLLLLVLIAFSYHPRFLSAELESSDQPNPLSRYITILTLLLIVLSLNIKALLKERFIKRFIITILYIILIGLFFRLFEIPTNFIHEGIYIGMALAFIIIGYNFDISQNSFILISLFFSFLIIFTGVAQVMVSIGAFVIEDLYLVLGKNSLGVIIASLLAFTLQFSFSPPNIHFQKLLRFLCIGTSIVFIILILTIRARTSAVAVIPIALIVAIKSNYSTKRWLLIIASIIIIMMFLPNDYGLSEIKSFISSSFTQNHEEDLSSGRNERLIDAFHIIRHYPTFGRINTDIDIEWVHNYLVRIITDYGFIGGCFFIYLYLYLVFFVTKGVLSKDNYHFYCVGLLCMLSPIVSSLTEPLFPYAPGSATFYSYWAFGLYLKHNRIKGNKIPGNNTLLIT